MKPDYNKARDAKYPYFPHSVLGTFCGYFYSLSKIVTKYLCSK